MANKIGTVRDVAKRVFAKHSQYKSSIIDIIPQRLLERRLRPDAQYLFDTGNVIDKVRFSRQGYLAAILGISEDYMVIHSACQELDGIISGSISRELSENQKKIIEEIRFIRDLVDEILLLS